MSLTGLATVLIRLYGLLLLFYSLQIGQRSYIFKTVSSPSQVEPMLRASIISSVAAGILYAIVGICLLIFAKTIAGWVTPRRSDRSDVIVTAADLALVSFSLAGIYFFIDGFSSLVHDGFAWGLAPKSFEAKVPLDANMIASLAASAIKASVGLFLLFGSRGVLRAIRWAREGSHSGEAGQANIEPPKGPKCPNCGAEYNPGNYRRDALEWVCSRCGAALPKE